MLPNDNQKMPKTSQRLIQNGVKTEARPPLLEWWTTFSFFLNFLVDFGSHLGASLVPKAQKNTSKNTSENQCRKNMENHGKGFRKPCQNVTKWWHKIDVKSERAISLFFARVSSKNWIFHGFRVPTIYQNSMKIHTNSMVEKLVPKWHTNVQHGSKIEAKSVPKCTRKSI